MSLKDAAQHLASRGRGPDTMLVHMAPSEVAGLQRLALAAGGSLSIHPETGLPEAGFLKNLLPTIIGAGLMMIPGVNVAAATAAGALTGAATNRENPLMGAITGGLGAYGGAGLAQGLGVAGAAAAPTAAAAPAAQTAAQAAPVMGASGAPLSAEAGQAMQASLAKAGYGGVPTGPAFADLTGTGRMEAIGRGAQSLMEPGGWDKFVGQAADKAKGIPADKLGGTSGFMTKAAMAAAPAAMAMPEQPKPDNTPMPEYEFDWNRIYAPGGGFTRKYAEGGETKSQMSGASKEAMDYLMGKTSVSPQTQAVQQRVAAAKAMPLPTQAPAGLSALTGKSTMPQYSYDPTTQRFTSLAAEPAPTAGPADVGSWGGEGGLAAGGNLQSGGFVVPADVVSALGNGSSSAGLEVLAKRFGAKPIDGPGDGMSDSIPTTIEGRQKARVARDEAYIAPDRVRAAGGAKKLYAMMDRIRAQAHGKTTQQRKINPNKAVG